VGDKIGAWCAMANALKRAGKPSSNLHEGCLGLRFLVSGKSCGVGAFQGASPRFGKKKGSARRVLLIFRHFLVRWSDRERSGDAPLDSEATLFCPCSQ